LWQGEWFLPKETPTSQLPIFAGGPFFGNGVFADEIKLDKVTVD
jgi:hypothetical protein